MYLHVGYPVNDLCELLEGIPCRTAALGDKSTRRSIARLLETMKFYHAGTFQHSLNVSRLSSLLAMKIGLSRSEVMEVSIGALLHDFGKTKIDLTILDKPGALTTEEWQEIRRHPLYGVHLLSSYPWAESLLPTVMLHHERVDGHGYTGKQGDQIPLGARIVCLADAFDSMISPRPYQPVRTTVQSWAELEKHSGTQFDPELVYPFILVTAKLLRYKQLT